MEANLLQLDGCRGTTSMGPTVPCKASQIL